jgi:hypothetical protein
MLQSTGVGRVSVFSKGNSACVVVCKLCVGRLLSYGMSVVLTAIPIPEPHMQRVKP